MVIIRKYLAKHIFYYFGLIALLLLGVHFALEVSYEIGNIGQGHFGIREALFCSLLYLPYDLYTFAPIGIMLSVLWAFSTLKINQELIIIRLNGYSVLRLLKEVTVFAAVLVGVLFFFGEEVSPKCLVLANRIKIQAVYAGKLAVTDEGNWLKYGNYFLNFKQIENDQIKRLFVYEVTESGEINGVYQTEMAQINEHNLTLLDVKIARINLEKIEYRYYSQYQIPVKIPKKVGKNKSIQKLKKDANQYSLKELRNNCNERRDLGLDYLREEVIYWQRIFTPLAILIMAWLGTLFTLKNERGKTAAYLLLGVMISFVYYTLTQMAGYIAVVYGYPTWLCTLLPSIGGFMVISYLLVKN